MVASENKVVVAKKHVVVVAELKLGAKVDETFEG